MTIEGETLATGAPTSCPACLAVVQVKVLRSAAGFYIGGSCLCGPAYSRESGYYRTHEEAEADLKSGDYFRL
jgi:hypothetical protein